mgnify:CR=1 FL=1
MDTFVEQIVAKRKGAKEWAIIIGSLVLCVLLVLFAFPFLFAFLSILAAALVVALGYGEWWLITSQNVEFEYSVTNGDIDIDQIIARRKRKRIVSVVGNKLEVLEPYNAAAYASRPFDRKVMAAPSEQDEGLWCFTYRSKKSGHTLVVFQPERRVLDALIVGLPAYVQRETNKKLADIPAEPAEEPSEEI